VLTRAGVDHVLTVGRPSDSLSSATAGSIWLTIVVRALMTSLYIDGCLYIAFAGNHHGPGRPEHDRRLYCADAGPSGLRHHPPDCVTRAGDGRWTRRGERWL
jgi:hypothetical protein